MHASTPILASKSNNGGGYCYHPQMSYSAEYIPAPPPYDTMQQQQQQQQQLMTSPTPTPSTSWTSEMSALAEKIKDDVANTFKGNTSKQTSNSLPNNIDRHSISQGMKLVSIAADEYEEGNESVALDIYLTGVDKILMALPNKTDMNTKMAIKEKLQSVEERVGILNLASSQKRVQQEQFLLDGGEVKSSAINSFILSRIASTISTVSSIAYQSAATSPSVVELEGAQESSTLAQPVQSNTSPIPTILIEGGGDPVMRFKKLGQYMIDTAVTCAVLIKQSPLPDLVAFLFGYLIQLFLWVDAQYHVVEKVQDIGIQCIKLGLQADERYRLHEFISEGLYMLVAAALKAAVAFKETPRYKGDQDVYENKSNTVNNPSRRNGCDDQTQQKPLPATPPTADSTCLPTSPQNPRSSWIWSPW